MNKEVSVAANKWKIQTDAALFHAGQLANVSALRDDTRAVLSYLALKEAWQCWLNELLGLTGCHGAPVSSLEQACMAVSEHHPEFEYLKNLQQTPNSWLHALHSRTSAVGSCLVQAPHTPPRSENSSSLIIAVAVGDYREVAHTEVTVLAEFSAYVKDVRARQTEW